MSLTFRSVLRKRCTDPSIGSSSQISVQKIFFRNQLTINNNSLWWPCLLTDRDELSNFYRGPSIDASYQVSVHLAKWFQRRRLKCEKLADARQQKTDDRRQVMATK